MGWGWGFLSSEAILAGVEICIMLHLYRNWSQSKSECKTIRRAEPEAILGKGGVR